jgi:pyruvate kinase
MDEEGIRRPVIAKIEKPQAVAALGDLIDAFDGFMVARGDLGVEMPLEDVPLVQKRVIELARRYAKPVVVATQMLESMISEPRPTRAEASDVANAVLDGADAVMLSGETSVGRYPIETVHTMSRIVASTERHGLDRVAPIDWTPRTKGGIIAKAAVEVAERMHARYLVSFTQSGDTALRLARFRSGMPLLAFTPVQAVRSWLSVVWGIETFLVPSVDHTDEMVRQVDRHLVEVGRCATGDTVVIVAGSPPGIPGSTNALRIHRIGDAITGVAAAYRD